MLAYFSTIPLCAYGRKGWMVVSMLLFDSTVKSNIAVGFLFWISTVMVVAPGAVSVPTVTNPFPLHCSWYDPTPCWVQLCQPAITWE